MCWCRPEVKTPNCGRTECAPPRNEPDFNVPPPTVECNYKGSIAGSPDDTVLALKVLFLFAAGFFMGILFGELGL